MPHTLEPSSLQTGDVFHYRTHYYDGALNFYVTEPVKTTTTGSVWVTGYAQDTTTKAPVNIGPLVLRNDKHVTLVERTGE